MVRGEDALRADDAVVGGEGRPLLRAVVQAAELEAGMLEDGALGGELAVRPVRAVGARGGLEGAGGLRGEGWSAGEGLSRGCSKLARKIIEVSSEMVDILNVLGRSLVRRNHRLR